MIYGGRDKIMNIKQQIFKEVYDFKIDKKFWDFTNLTGPQHDTERSKPTPYLKKTISIAKLLGLNTVVEIGSTRIAAANKCLVYYDDCSNAFVSPPCCNDGHSTIFWALEGFNTHTVDIDEHCIRALNYSFGNIKQEMPDNLHLHIPKDGIEFLEEFDGTIDVLFLDGWDVGRHKYREKHLEAYLTAKNKLADTHLILIDDTDFRIQDGGKDALLTPKLIEDGYFMLFNGRQTLFINKI